LDLPGKCFRIIIPGNGQVRFEFSLRVRDAEKAIDERKDIRRSRTIHTGRIEWPEVEVYIKAKDIVGPTRLLIMSVFAEEAGWQQYDQSQKPYKIGNSMCESLHDKPTSFFENEINGNNGWTPCSM